MRERMPITCIWGCRWPRSTRNDWWLKIKRNGMARSRLQEQREKVTFPYQHCWPIYKLIWLCCVLCMCVYDDCLYCSSGALWSSLMAKGFPRINKISNPIQSYSHGQWVGRLGLYPNMKVRCLRWWTAECLLWPEVHRECMFSRVACQLRVLNALVASTRRTPSESGFSKTCRMAWMPASLPAPCPAQSWMHLAAC